MSKTTLSQSQSLPGAAVAKPVGWVAARAAQFAGRRDANGPAPDITSGHTAYTQLLQGKASAAESGVSQALHTTVSQVDRDFVSLCAQVAHHHQAAQRTTREREALPADHPPGSLAAAQSRRDDGRLEAGLAGHLQQGTDLASKVAGLLATRRHLVDEARALVAGHAARFTQLSACHRRGYERRARRGPTAHTGAALPIYHPLAPWVTGDLPILIASIDPATRRVIEWALQEFDRPAPVTQLHAV